jgi:hypothetical protein
MRPLVLRSACPSCRVSVLHSFATLAGVSIAADPRLARPINRHASTSPFSQTCKRPVQQPPTEPTSTATTEPPRSPPRSSENDPSSLPWYLQVPPPEPPRPAIPPSTTLLDRQQIPPLPASPPPILTPLLNHISVTLGLDSLTLLDLRQLYPPPALGANLLMIIGTARSVRHLNVSADRLCRWLRSQYKLRPYADGLLGRNELKLKLRRRARRLKLRRSVGDTRDEVGADDGITTGWVCVNIGEVEDADTLEDGDVEAEDDAAAENLSSSQDLADADSTALSSNTDDGYIGFGSASTAPRIVVQMFTEEKRAEMDLEGLWDVRAARRANKEAAAVAVMEREAREVAEDDLYAFDRQQSRGAAADAIPEEMRGHVDNSTQAPRAATWRLEAM